MVGASSPMPHDFLLASAAGCTRGIQRKWRDARIMYQRRNSRTGRKRNAGIYIHYERKAGRGARERGIRHQGR